MKMSEEILTKCPKNMCNITVKICEECDYFDGVDSCEFYDDGK